MGLIGNIIEKLRIFLKLRRSIDEIRSERRRDLIAKVKYAGFPNLNRLSHIPIRIEALGRWTVAAKNACRKLRHTIGEIGGINIQPGAVGILPWRPVKSVQSDKCERWRRRLYCKVRLA